jgi:hypothetical protein
MLARPTFNKERERESPSPSGLSLGKGLWAWQDVQPRPLALSSAVCALSTVGTESPYPCLFCRFFWLHQPPFTSHLCTDWWRLEPEESAVRAFSSVLRSAFSRLPAKHNPISLHGAGPEQTMGGAQYYTEPWLHGTLFHIRWLTQAVESDFKNRYNETF